MLSEIFTTSEPGSLCFGIGCDSIFRGVSNCSYHGVVSTAYRDMLLLSEAMSGVSSLATSRCNMCDLGVYGISRPGTSRLGCVDHLSVSFKSVVFRGVGFRRRVPKISFCRRR